MQEMKYNELTDRAADSALANAERMDFVRQMEVRSHILGEVQRMRDSGEALTLTDEEMKLLSSFRRFKLRMRKDGEIFTWQSRRPEGVQLAVQTAQIIHPSEVR